MCSYLWDKWGVFWNCGGKTIILLSLWAVYWEMVYSWPLCFYQRIPTLQREAPTAPVFRSRPEIEDGFLHGGFWKYNAKPSNILPFSRDYLDNDENGHTIQDDVVVAGQDIAAGLIRMGILQRIQYLLEVCFFWWTMFLLYSSLWLWATCPIYNSDS